MAACDSSLCYYRKITTLLLLLPQPNTAKIANLDQSVLKHGRRTFLYSTFLYTMDMTAAILYILTAALSLGSQDYSRKSRMTTLGLAGVLFCKTSRHRQNGLSYVPNRILTWMLREARGCFKATVGNRVKPDYHFIRIVCCYFLFLSARFLCSLASYAQKHASTYRTLWA